MMASTVFVSKPEGKIKNLTIEDLDSTNTKITSQKKRSCIGRKKYSCKLCHNIFFQSESLSKHMRKHDAPIKCEYCSYSSFASSCMSRHLVKHGICKKMYQCRYCSNVFKSVVSRKQHEVSHTGVVCKVCERVFFTMSKLRTHEQEHSELNIHLCHLCNKSYPHKFMLNSHIKASHKRVSRLGEISYVSKSSMTPQEEIGSSFFTCQFCKKVFKHLNWLQLHEKKHIEAQKSVPVEESNLFSWQKHFRTDCILCGIPINSMRELRNHIKLEHQDAFGDRGYQNTGECNFCNKYVSPGPDNFIHAIGHLGFRPFKCHLCNYRTHWIKSIKIHLGKSHSANECYSCHKCNLTFSTFHLYKKHFKEEHNLAGDETSHLCHICGKSFNTTPYFKRHIKNCGKKGTKNEESLTSIETNSEHKCELCAAVHSSRELLEEHYKCHYPIEIHPCCKCDRQFIFKKQLNDHRNSHKENLICEDCGLEYDSYLMKLQHQNMCSLERRCTQCNFSASHGQYLSHHLKSEHSEVCLECDHCSELFASSKCFFKHLQSHSNHDPAKLYVPTADSEEEELFSIEYQRGLRSPKNRIESLEKFSFECYVCGHLSSNVAQLLSHEETHQCLGDKTDSSFLINCSQKMKLYKELIMKEVREVVVYIDNTSLLSYSKKEFKLIPKNKLNPTLSSTRERESTETTIVLPIAKELGSYYSSQKSEIVASANNIKQDLNHSKVEIPLVLVEKRPNIDTGIRRIRSIDRNVVQQHPSQWIKLNSLPINNDQNPQPASINSTDASTQQSNSKVIKSREKNQSRNDCSSSSRKDIITIDLSDDDDDVDLDRKKFPHQPQVNLVKNNFCDRLISERIVTMNGRKILVLEDCGDATGNDLKPS